MLGPPIVDGNATVNLENGNEIFPAMLAAIEEAKTEVCLETYTFAQGSPGERFRDVLVRAQQRGDRNRGEDENGGACATPHERGYTPAGLRFQCLSTISGGT